MIKRDTSSRLLPTGIRRSGKEKWIFNSSLLYRRDRRGGRLLGVFPLFGTLLKRYAKDEIHFYLWPFIRTRSQKCSYPKLPLAFFSYTSGEKKGYRIWPLYGRKEEVGFQRKPSSCGPSCEKTKGLDTDDPMHEWMVFPFYISKESKYFNMKTILWPLFIHAKEERAGFEQWDLPWPLFRTFKGENLYGRVLPFLRYKVREGSRRGLHPLSLLSI